MIVDTQPKSTPNIFRGRREPKDIPNYKKLQSALDVSDHGILVLERGRILYSNPRAHELLQLNQGELVGHRIASLRPKGLIAESLERALTFCGLKKGKYSEQFVIAENRITLDAQCAPLQSILVIIRTESAEASTPSNQGSETQNDSPKLDTEKITNYLIKLAELISRELPGGGEASVLCRKILTEITKTRAQDLVDAESTGSDSEAFSICRGLISMTQYSLPDNVRLEADIPVGSSGTNFPHSEIRHLVVLSILEAARELPKGGKVKFTARSGEENVVLRIVSDPGDGPIGPPDRIGLSQIKASCESLHGSLVSWCEDGGRVRLMNLPNSQRIDPEKPSKNIETIEGDGKTILLVDDEEVIRAVAKTALEKLGYKVLLARDGLEGIQVFKRNQDSIDLVILDLVMPRMGGAGCFEKIKEIQSDVRVILMSGFNRNRRVNDLMSKGCLFFLRKPFELKDLVTLVRETALVG